jgi:hypothetical protein
MSGFTLVYRLGQQTQRAALEVELTIGVLGLAAVVARSACDATTTWHWPLRSAVKEQ